MTFTILALIYTWRCNAECSFCCYSCSPRRKEKLASDIALSIVEQAEKIEGIQHLSITGGEPFLFLGEVKEILRRWKRTGFTSNCATNGFWASSEKRAYKILRELKEEGLTTLSLSCDSFHQEYVPLERVRHAFRAAAGLGIKVEVNCERRKGDSPLEELLPEIREVRGSYREAPPVPAGRGSTLSSEEFTCLESLPVERCGMLNTLAVTPTGTVYPCCSVFGETELLALGNIHYLSLRALIEEAQVNTLLLLMERQGFGTLIELGKKADPYLPLPSRVVNICHLCHQLLSNAESRDPLMKGVQEYEMEFLARAVQDLEEFPQHPPAE